MSGVVIKSALCPPDTYTNKANKLIRSDYAFCRDLLGHGRARCFPSANSTLYCQCVPEAYAQRSVVLDGSGWNLSTMAASFNAVADANLGCDEINGPGILTIIGFALLCLQNVATMTFGLHLARKSLSAKIVGAAKRGSMLAKKTADKVQKMASIGPKSPISSTKSEIGDETPAPAIASGAEPEVTRVATSVPGAVANEEAKCAEGPMQSIRRASNQDTSKRSLDLAAALGGSGPRKLDQRRASQSMSGRTLELAAALGGASTRRLRRGSMQAVSGAMKAVNKLAKKNKDHQLTCVLFCFISTGSVLVWIWCELLIFATGSMLPAKAITPHTVAPMAAFCVMNSMVITLPWIRTVLNAKRFRRITPKRALRQSKIIVWSGCAIVFISLGTTSGLQMYSIASMLGVVYVLLMVATYIRGMTMITEILKTRISSDRTGSRASMSGAKRSASSFVRSKLSFMSNDRRSSKVAASPSPSSTSDLALGEEAQKVDQPEDSGEDDDDDGNDDGGGGSGDVQDITGGAIGDMVNTVRRNTAKRFASRKDGGERNVDDAPKRKKSWVQKMDSWARRKSRKAAPLGQDAEMRWRLYLIRSTAMRVAATLTLYLIGAGLYVWGDLSSDEDKLVVGYHQYIMQSGLILFLGCLSQVNFWTVLYHHNRKRKSPPQSFLRQSG